MPAKKKKGGGKKKKGGKKKGAKAATEKEEVLKKCQEFLKTYQQHCSLPGRVCSLEVVRCIREGIENEKPPVKFFLDGSTLETAAVAKPDKAPVTTEEPTPPPAPPPPATPTFPRKVVQPLADSWVETKYNFVHSFYCWNMTLDDDAIVSLALYFESSVGSTMKALELREAGISPWAINRLARSLKRAQLTTVNLDFNRIPKDNLHELCRGLRTCPTVETLSLNFCRIDCYCGAILGSYIATSGVKEVSLIGNALACYGCSELVQPLIMLNEAIEATTPPQPEPPAEPTTENPRDGGEPAGGVTEPAAKRALPAPPALKKLFLQDNGIDLHTPCSTGPFNSVLCTREIKKFLICSPALEELNLEGNDLGDGGAREVMEGLQQRKEEGLPAVKISLSSQVSKELFTSIVELSVSKGAKKGKKKGKGKKKK